MKKVFWAALLLFIFAGCNEEQKLTESEKQLIEQHKIVHWNTLIEEERIRLKIPQEAWTEYLDYKRKDSGNKEYKRGKNWRERVLKDAEKDLQPYIVRQQVIARFQSAYPDNWQAKLLEYDVEQNRIAQEVELQRQIHKEQMREQRRMRRQQKQPTFHYVTPDGAGGYIVQ